MSDCLGPEERSHHLDDVGQKCVVFNGDNLLLKKAYCAHGHPLIHPQNPAFDHEKSIKLIAEEDGIKQFIYLSPFQNDPRKYFEYDYPKGTRVTLRCPVCEDPLPQVAPHGCHPEAMYVSIFMHEDGNPETSICVCNVWGCQASFAKTFDDVIDELRQYLPSPLLGDLAHLGTK